MQHVEFFHRDHFELRYHRKKARRSLSRFIDFFWETDFDPLYEKYPGGFSDALFPNIGYTYLINLGTPFKMQLEEDCFEMRSDGFLPRHKNMICHHSAGNRIFGIKFRVSPVIFEKKVNFSEYKAYIFPLAYLVDRRVMDAVKSAGGFEERVDILSTYYNSIIDKYSGSFRQVDIVTQVLDDAWKDDRFDVHIAELAANYSISARTLQRYFEAATSISSKQALQIMRIRKAVEQLTTDPANFHFSRFGYYDYSHFYKHLRQFLNSQTIDIVKPHLHILQGRTSA